MIVVTQLLWLKKDICCQTWWFYVFHAFGNEHVLNAMNAIDKTSTYLEKTCSETCMI